MKKHLPLFATVMVLAMSLFSLSCGNSDTSAAQASGATTSEPATADPAPDKPAAEDGINTVKGTFMSMDMGDYMHFNMRGDDGTELSFFVMDTPEDQIAPFEQGGMEGKAVEVTWRKSTRNIPEAGGEMEIEELVSVKVLE